MPNRPIDERRRAERERAILAALHQIHVDIDSLVRLLYPVQQPKDPVGSHQPPAEKDAEPEPKIAIRTVTEFGDAYSEQHKSDQKGTRDFERRYIRVQWFLFGAAFLAFGAAAYYAQVARQQKDTMDKTYGEIGKQTRATEVLAQAANETLASGQKSFKMEMRPYLSLFNGSLSKPLAPDSNPAVQLIFVNNGKTPAVSETVSLGVVKRENEIRDDEPDPPPLKYRSRSVVGPGTNFGVPQQANFTLSSEDINSLNHGALKLFAYGVVTYGDLFGDTHHVWFCVRYFLEMPPMQGPQLANCQNYNRVD